MADTPARIDLAEPEPAPAPGVWWRWAVVGLYMAVIFAVSSLSRLPTLPLHPSDKTLHGLAFGGLGLIVTWAASRGQWSRIGPRTILIAVLVCAAYGWTDEFHQRFVPGRQYDLWDLAADTAGGLAAAMAAWAWGIISRGSGRHDDV